MSIVHKSGQSRKIKYSVNCQGQKNCISLYEIFAKIYKNYVNVIVNKLLEYILHVLVLPVYAEEFIT